MERWKVSRGLFVRVVVDHCKLIRVCLPPLDLSNFFNFGSAQEEANGTQQPVQEPFDLRALLGDSSAGLTDRELASAVTSLYTSFSTPALVPWSTETLLCTDFEDIEGASPDEFQQPLTGKMFPSLEPGVVGTSSTPTVVDARYDSFGAEPAFDDVDGTALNDQGMFGLPLFGGLPSGGPVNADVQKVKAADNYGPLSPSHAMRLAGTVSPMEATLDLFAFSGRTVEPVSQTASPRNLFLPQPTPMMSISSALPPHLTRKDSDANASSPPTPLVEVANDFDGQNPESGKAKKAASDKKKKPYGPTGTRKSSRPLLDADAPTMSKSYVAPGATTRKLIPAGFQKKLKLQSDDMGDATLPENMGTDVQQGLLDEIEEKRRRNCVAARESRKRKQDYQNGLKNEIRSWRSWAEQIQAKLKEAGLDHFLEDVVEFAPAPVDLDE